MRRGRAIGLMPIQLKLHCAESDVNTFDDGSKWDFSGHNAFYGPFEYSSK